MPGRVIAQAWRDPAGNTAWLLARPEPASPVRGGSLASRLRGFLSSGRAEVSSQARKGERASAAHSPAWTRPGYSLRLPNCSSVVPSLQRPGLPLVHCFQRARDCFGWGCPAQRLSARGRWRHMSLSPSHDKACYLAVASSVCLLSSAPSFKVLVDLGTSCETNNSYHVAESLQVTWKSATRHFLATLRLGDNHSSIALPDAGAQVQTGCAKLSKSASWHRAHRPAALRLWTTPTSSDSGEAVKAPASAEPAASVSQARVAAVLNAKSHAAPQSVRDLFHSMSVHHTVWPPDILK